MEYRVILTKNGKYKKTLHKCKTIETSMINYRIIKKENEGVFFPRRFINYNGIKPVEYTIYVVKTPEEGDTRRFVRDKMGRLSEESLLFDKWLIIDSAKYEVEETFWVWPYNPKEIRFKIHDIVKLIVKGAHKKDMTKEIIVVHNKLIIYNEDQFVLVVCKCTTDAERLQHAIQKAAKKSKIKSFIFMGKATPATVSRMYELIHEKTGWPYRKIRRTSTRP